MKMTEKLAYYSLTKEPADLKEAVDWMVRITGGDNIFPSDTDKLVKALNGVCDLKHAGNLGIELQNRIIGLGSALKTFIGYDSDKTIGNNGIGKDGKVKRPGEINAYTPAYYGSSWALGVEIGVEWSKKINKRKAIRCFFSAIQHIYVGLTELYYNCKKDWKNDNLGGISGGTDLKQFMNDNGFDKAKLNSNMTGKQIISQSLQDFNEFTTAYNSAGQNPSLADFRSQLEQNASTSPSNYPLSALYILATYVYVQSSSPVTPSFAGYSGLTALAGGAYGFNLGGLGTLMSALLA
ncbi:variant erythrocyte surface antigen-1 family protein [Babesia caballi]|uniref:Variant erythrocyte surface antigen-1 family protein n=1 Tax=Babesia caballi TaxID=5871 RepID=A0AAV4LSD4_BABCB|nr:variant erythrocyte surface antigen-1 family protein [Babesia caballi]